MRMRSGYCAFRGWWRTSGTETVAVSGLSVGDEIMNRLGNVPAGMTGSWERGPAVHCAAGSEPSISLHPAIALGRLVTTVGGFRVSSPLPITVRAAQSAKRLPAGLHPAVYTFATFSPAARGRPA